MAKRNIIVLGDRTTHGGTVISAWGQDGGVPMTINGKPVACVGDYVYCPKCRGTHQIIEGAENPPMELNGRRIALEGCRVSDGSQLLSVGQDIAWHMSEGDGAMKKAASGAQTGTAAKGIQTADATPGISKTEADALKNQQKTNKTCQCGGPHPLKIVGDEVKPIKSYTGALRAPGLLFKMDESPRRIDARTIENSRRIRRWAKEAAEYHEIPYEMLAVILEQENGQNVSAFRRFAQGYERFLQFSGAILKDATGVPVPGSAGSTGIINMLRSTLLETISYTEGKYARSMLPGHKKDIDSGFAGVDVEADLYYGAAHIRFLIDNKGKNPCTKGELTLEQIGKVFTRYNGTKDEAQGYGKAALNKLLGAYNGTFTLHFYEK